MQQGNYYIKNPIVKAAMRILSWILLFLGAFSMAQAVMIFVNEVNLGQVSIPVVIVFLFLTPFMLHGGMVWPPLAYIRRCRDRMEEVPWYLRMLC